MTTVSVIDLEKCGLKFVRGKKLCDILSEKEKVKKKVILHTY